MKKAYLNVLMDTSGPVPTVVEVEICPTPGHRVSSTKTLYQFWATVDECEARTLALAEQCLRGRLELAADKPHPFRTLLGLVQEDWDPVLSDAPGG